jgi:RNA polymerase sigma-70 factor (ECF subfamily)
MHAPASRCETPSRRADAPVATTTPSSTRAAPSFDDAYERHVDSVSRALVALGVPAACVDDAVQDVFIVVHRRLAEFEGRASLKTWILAIATRVAREYRRRARRADHLRGATVDDELPDRQPYPDDLAAQSEALTAMTAALAALDDDQRVV